jgi:hypothetical protein
MWAVLHHVPVKHIGMMDATRSLPRPSDFKLMGWMAPSRHLGAKLVVIEDHQKREPSMKEITMSGPDLAKNVFQVNGV